MTSIFAEEKKAPLLQMPMSKKRDMLSMNTKTMARTQYESPQDYIQYLVRGRKDCLPCGPRKLS